MKKTNKICTSILISVNELKYSHGNMESGVHEFSGVANKRCYSSRTPKLYYSRLTRENIEQNSQQKQDFERIPLNVKREYLNKALWIKDHCRMETKPLFISSTGIYITSPLQRQCSSRTPKQHSDQQQIAPSSFIVRLAPIKKWIKYWKLFIVTTYTRHPNNLIVHWTSFPQATKESILQHQNNYNH